MLDTENSPIGNIIQECGLPKEMSYYIAEADTAEVREKIFQEFSLDVRAALGPDFLNDEQKAELFNFVCSKNVKSHVEILLSYRKYAALLTRIHDKRTKDKGTP